MFVNCRTYNGKGSIIGKIGLQVQAEAEKLLIEFKKRENFKSESEHQSVVVCPTKKDSVQVDVQKLQSSEDIKCAKKEVFDNEMAKNNIFLQAVSFLNTKDNHKSPERNARNIRKPIPEISIEDSESEFINEPITPPANEKSDSCRDDDISEDSQA